MICNIFLLQIFCNNTDIKVDSIQIIIDNNRDNTEIYCILQVSNIQNNSKCNSAFSELEKSNSTHPKTVLNIKSMSFFLPRGDPLLNNCILPV